MIKLLINNIKILKIIPIKVIPNIKIIIRYIRLIEILFLKARIESILLVLILSINSLILSVTRALSFRPIMLAKIAPEIRPRNRIITTKILVFLFGKILRMVFVYFLIIISPIKLYS